MMFGQSHSISRCVLTVLVFVQIKCARILLGIEWFQPDIRSNLVDAYQTSLHSVGFLDFENEKTDNMDPERERADSALPFVVVAAFASLLLVLASTSALLIDPLLLLLT